MNVITKEQSGKFVVGRTYYWAFYIEYDVWRMVPVFSTWVYMGWTDEDGCYTLECPLMKFVRMTDCGPSTETDRDNQLLFRSYKDASNMRTFDEFLELIPTKRPPWDL